MNRRTLLQAMSVLPIAGALGGCRPKRETESSSDAAQAGTLRVTLHGPFALIIEKYRKFRIRAFVPFDDQKAHEFRLLSQSTFRAAESGEGKYHAFQFELSESGLEENLRPPYIDHGFDDLTFALADWKPKEYFVSLDLPAPEVITYQPGPTAVENVVFDKNNRPGVMPLDHILEYRVRDIRDVKMRSPQLGDILPLSCPEVHRAIEESRAPVHGDGMTHPPTPPAGTNPRLTHSSDSNAICFLFGVGLPRRDDPKTMGHALHFFNGPLLHQFPEEVQEELRLKAIGVNPCSPLGDIFGAPTLVPAVQRLDMPGPWLRPVAAIEDCRLGGVIATVPN